MNTVPSHYVAAVALSAALSVGTSAQTTLDASVFTNAGGLSEVSTITLTSAVGQLSPIGPTSSENSGVSSGFIYLIGLAPTVNACLIDFILPQIAQPSTGAATAGQPTIVSAFVTDNVGVGTVTLQYRTGGGSNFTSANMAVSGNQYDGTIPASAVTSNGIEYKIRAVDDCDLIAVHPTSGVEAIRVDVGGEGVVAGSSQPSGSSESAYRLVSFPLELENASRSVVVDDDLGPIDNTKWRMFALSSNQSASESPSTIQAGRGYWLIARDGGRLDSGPGRTFATNAPYSVTLNAGWTFVGNPFAFDIPISRLSLESGEAADIRSFTGSWVGASSQLRPFVGYAVTNETQTTDRLLIDPVLTPGKTSSRSVAEMLSGLEWSVGISAQVGQATDTDNLLGVSAQAESEWDVLDRPEPPVIGEYVSVHFPHEQWDKPLKRYRTDVRGIPDEGARWQLRVETPIAGDVSLVFDGIEDVPSKYDLWLVDGLVKSRHDLREKPRYTFTSSGMHHRDLTVVVGIGDYVKKTLEASGVVPERYVLDQNFPNPFGPSTTIRFGLPERGKVSLVVYDLLGRRVATLLEGNQEKGYHTVVWDGRDLDGRSVASGVYVHQLKAGQRILNRKMLLLR